MTTQTERPVLLVGSVPLKTAEEVFTQTAGALGALLQRIPDGETDERTDWVTWQLPRVASTPGLTAANPPDGVQFRMREGVKASDVSFGPLGYAEKAIESYAVFRRLRDSGSIPRDTRFQVSLPTPLAVMFCFVASEHVRDLWPIYERRMFAEVDEIAKAIPHSDLAVQWDIAVEICFILENPAVAKDWPINTVIDPIIRAAARVPPDVELGLHFCYGDPGHKHVVEPKDTGLMVDMANRISAALTRPVTWMHMPVPRSRNDNAYFAPLHGLKVPRETTLFLGLVHLTDGVPGAAQRLTAARSVRADFGIATECGLGRRPPETIPELLALHRQVAGLGA